jgi:hypothetical protein
MGLRVGLSGSRAHTNEGDARSRVEISRPCCGHRAAQANGPRPITPSQAVRTTVGGASSSVALS